MAQEGALVAFLDLAVEFGLAADGGEEVADVHLVAAFDGNLFDFLAAGIEDRVVFVADAQDALVAMERDVETPSGREVRTAQSFPRHRLAAVEGVSGDVGVGSLLVVLPGIVPAERGN